VSSSRFTTNQRFSYSPSPIRSEATNRLASAGFKARLYAIGSKHPTSSETQQRMRRIADLSEQLIEALTGKAVNSNELQPASHDISSYIDTALSTDLVENGRTLHYSREISSSLAQALVGVRFIRERALATLRDDDTEIQKREREANHFQDALLKELGTFWKWATGEPPRFSTPHQKSRKGFGSIMIRPKEISTEKTGPFVDFAQEFLALIGEPPTTGRSIAARMVRIKKQKAV
jgi:hypothetical protein